jgi:hypothetical protein
VVLLGYVSINCTMFHQVTNAVDEPKALTNIGTKMIKLKQ